MSKYVFSATLVGVDPRLVTVEVDYRHGLSHFAIVGLADRSIQEAKERVIPAIRNSGLEFIPMRTIINLAPSNIKKYGTHFDLAIAISFLESTGQIKLKEPAVFIGELSLKGRLKAVDGLIAMATVAKLSGIRKVFVPMTEVNMLAVIPGIEVVGVSSLANLVEILRGGDAPFSTPQLVDFGVQGSGENACPLLHISGQSKAKKALEIAIAGKHNLLMMGPPGCGKTMLARAGKDLMPILSNEEMSEVIIIKSVAGKKLIPKDLYSAPFISPHHSATLPSIVGGGAIPTPGAVTLAHNGILLLDEFAEFPRDVINSLRQPLENKVSTVSRATYQVDFPSNFLLLATMNICPCGNAGSRRVCRCSLEQKNRYLGKVSGPIMDRFDLVLELSPEPFTVAGVVPKGISSVKERIQIARAQQLKRWGSRGFSYNSDISSISTLLSPKMLSSSKALLSEASESLGYSYRALGKLVSVALTIADLDGEEFSKSHISQALSFMYKVSRETS